MSEFLGSAVIAVMGNSNLLRFATSGKTGTRFVL